MVIRRAYRILVVVFKGPLGRPRKRREGALKMDFIEACWEDDCILLAETRNSFNDHDNETSCP